MRKTAKCGRSAGHNKRLRSILFSHWKSVIDNCSMSAFSNPLMWCQEPTSELSAVTAGVERPRGLAL